VLVSDDGAPMAAVAVVIAHRGDPVHQREITLAAFVSAVARGADMAELDLQLTLDGEVVVLHDATLQRLWGIDRRVNELELAQLPCGEGGIPTFAEVLAAVVTNQIARLRTVLAGRSSTASLGSRR
jgi:glycerophosphoryl diester phosphodiesterase